MFHIYKSACQMRRHFDDFKCRTRNRGYWLKLVIISELWRPINTARERETEWASFERVKREREYHQPLSTPVLEKDPREKPPAINFHLIPMYQVFQSPAIEFKASFPKFATKIRTHYLKLETCLWQFSHFPRRILLCYLRVANKLRKYATSWFHIHQSFVFETTHTYVCTSNINTLLSWISACYLFFYVHFALFSNL